MFQSTHAVKTIFYLNVFVFLALSILTLFSLPIDKYLQMWNWRTTDNFLPYQLVTYQFLHGGILHILLNMLAFLSFGPTVENWLDTKKFWIYYLICGVGSALFHVLMANSTSPMVGASGSIWGICVIYAFILPNERLRIIFLPIDIKAKWLFGGFFLLELFWSLVGDNSNIAHWAHIGGGLSGCLLFLFEKYVLNNRNHV